MTESIKVREWPIAAYHAGQPSMGARGLLWVPLTPPPPPLFPPGKQLGQYQPSPWVPLIMLLKTGVCYEQIKLRGFHKNFIFELFLKK